MIEIQELLEPLMHIEYRYTVQKMKDGWVVSIIGEAEGDTECAVKCFPCKDRAEAIEFMKKGLTQMPFAGHTFTHH